MSKHDPRHSSHRNRVALLTTGGAYFQRMEALIDGARHSIHLQVYIMADDATGARIGAALVRAAGRGVRVHVLADGYASRDVAPALIEGLRAAGGHFEWFEPLWRSSKFYIGRRLHHKVLVVDHRFALVSGRNIADRYNDSEGQPAWYDVALDVEGEAAVDLEQLCCMLWNGNAARVRRARAVPPTPEEARVLFGDWPADVHCIVRVRYNDWLRGHSEITDGYATMFRAAQKEIRIVSSYFVPGRHFKRMLAGAARRGVRVVVVTGGRSDIWIAKPAERWLYAWLLRRGIEVYEYQGPVLHAKVAARDGAWCTVGSFNINDLSTYTTLEVNLDVEDAKVARLLEQEIDRIGVNEPSRITQVDERRVGPFTRLVRWVAYRTVRLMHVLLTWYYQRERPHTR